MCVVLLSFLIFLVEKRQQRQQEAITPGNRSKETQEWIGREGALEIPRPPGTDMAGMNYRDKG